MSKKRKKSVRTLKNRLDILFSQYIRHRDTGFNEYGSCCSCGKNVKYKDGDAGHFVSRGKQMTRYDETNVHLQCRKCNRFENGNMIGYYQFMENKYGKEHILELQNKGQEEKHWTINELEELIQYYESRIRQMV